MVSGLNGTSLGANVHQIRPEKWCTDARNFGVRLLLTSCHSCQVCFPSENRPDTIKPSSTLYRVAQEGVPTDVS